MRVFNPLRSTVSLDGPWSFQYEQRPPEPILVPGPWEARRPELHGLGGTAIYERAFTLPAEFEGSEIVIRFGAVDYYAEVWINDVPVGTHAGGYTPFHFRIDSALTGYGADLPQTVRVRVTDSAMGRDSVLPDGTLLRFGEIPHGKQSWYTSISGIWQSVSIEARSEAHVEEATFRPDIDAGTVEAALRVTGLPANGAAHLRIAVTPPPGAGAVPPILAAAHAGPGGCAVVTANFAVPDALLWSPDAPHLYHVRITLEMDGEDLDSVTKRFGLRKVETREGRVWLNNHPIFLAGALDQAFYPRTIYTPPSRLYLRDQFLKAKEMGLNLIRCHIKVPTEEYLELCDELGLLVWYELPNGDNLSPAFRDRAWETWEAMHARDANHPCVIILTIMNESWGIDLHDPEQRQWLRETYHRAKSAFPDWLIVDNSACLPNFHVASDLDDYHIYYSIPDHADKFAEWIENFVQRENGTYSAYGDAEYRHSEPLILSEFGNWGLPNLEKVIEAEGGEPYWFRTGQGAVRPENVLERFAAQRLDRAYPDYAALAAASQEQEWISLKWEIEEMRRHSGLAGYVITELTDVNWECNGLLDMGRNPKVFHHRLAEIQKQDILVPRLGPRAAFWEGERATLAVDFSCFSGRSAAGGTVSWEVQETICRGALPDPCPVRGLEGVTAVTVTADREPAFGTYSVARIGITAPQVDIATKAVIRLVLRDAKGAILAANTQNVVFVPAMLRTFGAGTKLHLHDPLRSASNPRTALASLGFTLSSPEEGPVLATKWDSELAHYLRAGGKALLVAEEKKSLTLAAGLGFDLSDRDTNDWWGDWCSSKIWFAGDYFPTLPDIDRFDFEFQKVVPKRVITGPLPDNILSGLFLGWLRSPSALVVRLPIGRGQLLITTFDLLPHLGSDPVATVLLHDLLALTAK